MLARMAISRRLGLLIVGSLVGFAVLMAFSMWALRSKIIELEKQRVHNVVEATGSVFSYFHGLEQAGSLSREAAQKQAIAQLRALRYDGDNYVFIYDTQAVTILSPAKPETEGHSMAGKTDPKGTPLFDRFAEVARSGQPAQVDYLWPHLGSDTLVPKTSYVQAFQPWGWAYGSGVYLDTADTAMAATLLKELGLAVVLLLAGVLVSWRVMRSILGQLGGEPTSAVETMRRVAAGDLQIGVEGQGGNGSLLGVLASMVANLRHMVAEIGRSAEQVTAQSRAISRVTGNVSDKASVQAESTSSIAAAVEEMTVSISHISDAARDTQDSSSRAAALAEQGEQRAATAMKEMERIAGTVDHASGTIQQLVSRAQEIGSIANVIKEIAAQTNLLALNAAIEAARAGEQGRGFAVVADEVRGLAERTASATLQIEQMIQGIQVDSGGAVTAMSEVASQVQGGVSLVQGAAASLREIREGTEIALERIRDVADGTKEQSAASTAIAQQVEQIAQMVESTSASMQSTAGAVESLERLASDLQSLIGRFHY